MYVSCWLKHYHPAAFTAALINSQPMGFYAPAQLVRNVREHGVEVRAVDVNASEWDCTLEPELRLGFRLLGGFSQTHAEQIVQARGRGQFRSWEDFLHRTQFSRAVLTKLAEGDVFGSLGLSRRQAMWHALAQDKRTPNLPLFAGCDDDEETPDALPTMSLPDQVLADYQSVGMSLKAHPVSFCRGRLDELAVVPAKRLARIGHGRMVRVAGLVLVRQRPSTAKGITFVTLEDETGVTNLIIRQDVWTRFHKIARTATALIAHGRLQREDGMAHVLVTRLEDLSEIVTGLNSRSRDFH